MNLNQLDINVLLPILTGSITSPSVVFHCMKMVMRLTNHLNYGQTTIMVADQLVYAIAKQLQWCYPGQCRTLFIMLGPLHIEMAFMSAIGDWVKGSGWTDIFNRAKSNSLCPSSITCIVDIISN